MHNLFITRVCRMIHDQKRIYAHRFPKFNKDLELLIHTNNVLLFTVDWINMSTVDVASPY